MIRVYAFLSFVIRYVCTFIMHVYALFDDVTHQLMIPTHEVDPPSKICLYFFLAKLAF